MPSSNEPPNLNSPPGMTPPHQPPSAQSLAPLSTTGQNDPAHPTPLANPNAQQNFVYYSCLAVTVGVPIVIAMPPRKLDPYTFGLAIAWCASTGVVLEQRTGHGLVWHVGSLLPSQSNAERRAKEEAQREEKRMRAELLRGGVARGMQADEKEGLVEQVRQHEEAKKMGERGIVKRLWMGREGDDWIEKRAEQEREALDDGRGYQGLIMDYIKEAFGFSTKDDDDDD